MLLLGDPEATGTHLRKATSHDETISACVSVRASEIVIHVQAIVWVMSYFLDPIGIHIPSETAMCSTLRHVYMPKRQVHSYQTRAKRYDCRIPKKKSFGVRTTVSSGARVHELRPASGAAPTSGAARLRRWTRAAPRRPWRRRQAGCLDRVGAKRHLVGREVRLEVGHTVLRFDPSRVLDWERLVVP